jgi:peroxiredoxin family protein
MKTKVKKMLFILSKATIENVYAAFIMANGARMEGIEAEIFFTFFGLEAIQKKKLTNLRHVRNLSVGKSVGLPLGIPNHHKSCSCWILLTKKVISVKRHLATW